MLSPGDLVRLLPGVVQVWRTPMDDVSSEHHSDVVMTLDETSLVLIVAVPPRGRRAAGYMVMCDGVLGYCIDSWFYRP